MAAVRLRAALNTAMAISRLGNVFLQDSAPWVALKTDRTAAGTIIAVAANLVRLLSVILEPFMPGFSDKICYQLNMDHGNIPDEWTYVPRRAWGARSRVCVCVWKMGRTADGVAEALRALTRPPNSLAPAGSMCQRTTTSASRSRCSGPFRPRRWPRGVRGSGAARRRRRQQEQPHPQLRLRRPQERQRARPRRRVNRG